MGGPGRGWGGRAPPRAPPWLRHCPRHVGISGGTPTNLNQFGGWRAVAYLGFQKGGANQVFQFFYYVKKILAKGGHGRFGQGVNTPLLASNKWGRIHAICS